MILKYNYAQPLLACVLLCFALFSCTKSISPTTSNPARGDDVVKAMYDRWENKWYPNFAFEQRAIFYKNDTITRQEVWQEIYSQPGNLHIRFNGFESGNGVVFKSDSVYNFSNNQLQSRQHTIHPLVLLIFDVYFYRPETTVAKLQQLGFDLSQVSEANWQGRPAYVIGTSNPTDTGKSQFWIDKENLYVLRVLTSKHGTVRDVEMNKYEQIGKHQVATEIVFKTNGKTTLREEYYNISFPETIDNSIFEPENFKTAKW